MDTGSRKKPVEMGIRGRLLCGWWADAQGGWLVGLELNELSRYP